ncbi:PAS domain-containing protein [Sphingomonas aliaeris]|uniref:PAS domain-containing protein n=1 Tax=Sphingomonas aliaeris TaxID=2759526 RepID=A0A974S368_9SPHN|nr:PAS domain-containing protein [Sphingomonas aliaeris]QQV76242.1 PAS domain-containing protein [Sphingomonas aliaeris]
MVLMGHSLATADGRLLAVDPQVSEILHREERDLIGVTFQSITHPGDLDGNVAAVTALRVQDGPVSLRKRYVRPDGSAVWSSIQVSRLHADDGSKLVGTIQLVASPFATEGPQELWKSAKRLTALIERRRTELTDELFNDYPWLILLQIYLAEAEARKADLANISDALSLRGSATERWVRVLENKGLIERSKWTDSLPQLTTLGVTKVERLLLTDIPV